MLKGGFKHDHRKLRNLNTCNMRYQKGGACVYLKVGPKVYTSDSAQAWVSTFSCPDTVKQVRRPITQCRRSTCQENTLPTTVYTSSVGKTAV
jgi:hypothetical protein